MVKFNLLSRVVFAALGLTIFSNLGCGSDSSSNASSEVRLVNAVIGLTAPTNLNISSRDVLQASNLPFGGASSTMTIPSGSASLTIKQAATGGTLLTETVTFSDFQSQTAAVVGSVGGSGTAMPHVVVFTDKAPSGLTDGGGDVTKATAAIRLVNLSPDAPALDIYRETAGLASPVLGLTNVSFGNASSYVITTPGAFTLTVHDTNTGSSLPTQTPMRGVNLTGGKAYTVFIVGLKTPAAGQEALDARLTLDN